MFRTLLTATIATALATSALAASPRELLTTAAFQTTDKAQARALVDQALQQADGILVARPADREGRLEHAMSIGYRARLTKNPADAKTSRKLFEALVASNPRDAEFQLALGGWHLDAIAAGFLAATVLGAKKDIGLAALDRSVALGGDRAFFRSMAALMRIRLDPADVTTARVLAEQAAAAPAPTPLDRIGQREAQQLLVPLRAGDGYAAQKLARILLPFGRIKG